MKHTVFPVPRFPHNFCLTANEKDFSLPLEMTMQERRHSPSFLWKEVARSARGWLRSLLPSATPLPFGHPPSTGRDRFLPLFPPSSGRRCPEGAEIGFCSGLKRNGREAFPRFVIPSAAEGSFSFPVSLFLRNAVCMKHRNPTSQRVRCFPLSAVLTFPDRSRMKKISRFRSK